MPYTVSGEFGFVIWVHYLGVRDREAANAGVASAPGIRQRFEGSTAGGAAGRRALTAEQELRFGSFGEGHATITWD